MHSKPGFIIWSGAIVCVAFAVAALSDFLAQTSDAGRGDAVRFVMVMSLLAVASVWRLVRRYREAAEVPDIAQVPIGVPIRPARRKTVSMALLLLVTSVLPLVLMHALPATARLLAWLFILIGVAILAATAGGLLPPAYLELRDDGLVITTRGAPLVLPWERIEAVEGAEFSGNPAFFLWIEDPETIALPPPTRRAFLRQVGFCRANMQCEYFHVTTAYDVSLPKLVAAIEDCRMRQASAPGLVR